MCRIFNLATWVKRRRCPSGANYLFRATCLNYLIFHLPSLGHYKPWETTEEMSTREHNVKKVVANPLQKQTSKNLKKSMEKSRIFLPLFSILVGRKIYKKNITLLRIPDCRFQLQNILHLKRSVWLALIRPVLMLSLIHIWRCRRIERCRSRRSPYH